MSKLTIGIGTFGESAIASFIPALWHGGMLASVLFSVIGASLACCWHTASEERWTDSDSSETPKTRG